MVLCGRWAQRRIWSHSELRSRAGGRLCDVLHKSAHVVRFLVPIALALSTSALAQTSSRPEVVRGLCQPDGCSEFAVTDAREIATDGEGKLLKTRLKTFHASREGRKDLGEEDGYVYCPPTRPAILADQEGRTMAFFLAPFATAESREAVRRNGNFYAVYFAMCHGVEAG